jgi:hypothetical protein
MTAKWHHRLDSFDTRLIGDDPALPRLNDINGFEERLELAHESPLLPLSDYSRNDKRRRYEHNNGNDARSWRFQPR